MVQIMARPCFKTSGFGCTVDFYFASLYLRCFVDDPQRQGESKLKIYTFSNNILSLFLFIIN